MGSMKSEFVRVYDKESVLSVEAQLLQHCIGGRFGPMPLVGLYR